MNSKGDIVPDTSTVLKMIHEKNRLSTFTDKGQWPFLKDCNCTPEKMASAGFYWCGTESQPDLVRCFVCLQDFEDWDPDDIPKDEHRRLCPNCPFVKMVKTQQDDCTVKEVCELAQKSLLCIVDKMASQKVDQYVAQAQQVREVLVSLSAKLNIPN